MKKINKIFVSLGAFIMSLITKVYATGLTLDEILKNGNEWAEKIKPKTTSIADYIINGAQAIFTIIPFIIGSIIIFNKKISKKQKIIIISILVGLIIIANLIALFYNNREFNSVIL